MTDTPPKATDYQPVAVLLRVTCLSGYWRGVVHYHHILPVPEEADKTWFDERFVKEAENPEGIVRVGKTSLLHYVECMDEPMEQLFWAGGETLRQIYEEEMVGTLEWVGLQSDFDGKPISGDMTLRELVESFIATNPKPGEPLILIPIFEEKSWTYSLY